MIPLFRDDLKLVPTKDLAYIAELAQQYKFNHYDNKGALEILEKVGYCFWEVYNKDVKSGVIYISQIAGVGYFLDAYKDMRVENKVEDSFRVGEMVVDYFHKNIGPVLWTAHDVRNKIATLLCKGLGFVEMNITETELGKFIILARYNKGEKNGN